MRIVRQWQGSINGKIYDFAYTRKMGKNVIYVNGNPIAIKQGFLSLAFGLDEKFTFEGIEARLVLRMGIPDVAVNNTFLQSGRKYIPRPDWVIVFVILCILIPVFSGGALYALFGMGGAAICVKLSTIEQPVGIRVFLCIVVTLLVWLPLFFRIAGGLSLMMLQQTLVRIQRLAEFELRRRMS